VAPRHRSLYAVFLSAWEALREDERAVLRRLAVFRGGFDRRAAERVAGAGPAHLSAPADKSWLRPGGSGRYAMFETVRHFVVEMLPGDVSTAAAHARYFADFLAERQAALRLGRSEALAQVAGEIENLRAAWQWAIQQGDLDLLARAAEGLGCFLETRSWLQEGAEAFGGAHDLALRAGGWRGALLLAWEGLFAFRLADYTRAQALLETARALLKTDPTPELEAFVLNYLGCVAERVGRREEAQGWFESSAQRARAAGDDWALARALNNLGHLHYLTGDLTAAQEALGQALALRRPLDDRPGIAKTLINLAMVWQVLQQYDQAHAAEQESLAIFRELGNRLGAAICLNNLGFLAYRQGQYVQARELYAEALRLRRELGDDWGIVVALDNLGAVACELGEYATACAHYAE